MDLRRFIRQRWKELEGELLPLHARRDQLVEELRTIEHDISTIEPQLSEMRSAAEAIGMDLTYISEHSRAHGETTIKQGIRMVLNVHLDGLTSSDLHALVSRDFFDGNLDRTSFSPQLSRMRRDGEVDLGNTIWTLTDYGREVMHGRARGRLASDRKENEPSDDPASDGSDAGPINPPRGVFD
ncbi:hypothetical protein [Methylobacterium symbioticum]|uniref:hypothetical protein n=1 Tax=Methylobacterium symbioticum TaxID=2584084 RepID=UPI00115B8801|nr:hypothetical protein [Methylobacterium symbioticum]